ncbi:MAG TPA: prephenate dehydrogenase [Candidatus Acidoferrales bacterium]|nr:prephenate dehydrogenase [Candidatus Acidoferrales bacterium]
MPKAPAEPFRRVAILGTGLIGGSFALALRKHLPEVHITGFDREPVLLEALERGLIHENVTDIRKAVSSADLVYIALPISTTIELLPQIARHSPPHALVTDAGSTKRAICRAAEKHFVEGGPTFLGGHPMAGRETHGPGEASVDLFRGAKYVLIGGDVAGAEFAASERRVEAFVALLEAIGARTIWLDAETHDWAVAIVSHLPQMLAVALAGMIAEETDESGLPESLAGPGVREILRLAGSPYAMWRDIAFTNSDNLKRALDRLAQAIDQLRNQLTTRDLERSFAAANRLYKSLREVQ